MLKSQNILSILIPEATSDLYHLQVCMFWSDLKCTSIFGDSYSNYGLAGHLAPRGASRLVARHIWVAPLAIIPLWDGRITWEFFSHGYGKLWELNHLDYLDSGLSSLVPMVYILYIWIIPLHPQKWRKDHRNPKSSGSCCPNPRESRLPWRWFDELGMGQNVVYDPQKWDAWPPKDGPKDPIIPLVQCWLSGGPVAGFHKIPQNPTTKESAPARNWVSRTSPAGAATRPSNGISWTRCGCPGWILTYWKILEMFQSYEWIWVWYEYETVRRFSSKVFLREDALAQNSRAWLWCTVLLWNHNPWRAQHASSEPELRVFDVKDGWETSAGRRCSALKAWTISWVTSSWIFLSAPFRGEVSSSQDIHRHTRSYSTLAPASRLAPASPATQGMPLKPLKSEWKMDDPDVTTKMWIRGSKSCQSCQSQLEEWHPFHPGVSMQCTSFSHFFRKSLMTPSTCRLKQSAIFSCRADLVKWIKILTVDEYTS